MTAEEARVFLGKQLRRERPISLTTLWRWEKAGILVPRRIGDQRLYVRAEVLASIESTKGKPPTPGRGRRRKKARARST
jgi:hypothetical protein